MLGRGLESLIPQKDDGRKPSPNKPATISGEPVPAKPSEAKHQSHKKIFGGGAIFQIEVHKIKPNPHQPRRDFDKESLKELAASIREFGVIQPLVVSKIEKETETGADVEYQLITGERRLRAAEMLGWERVPAIIKNTDSEKEHLELAVVENLQRENLNPIETARAYAKLQDEFNLTQREIAARLGKSRETISNTIRLLGLPREIQEALSRNQISESQARLLLAIPDLNKQEILFRDLLKNNLSVRELKDRVRKTKPTQANIPRPAGIDPETLALQEKLSEALGAKVKIKKGEAGGQIIIEFYSAEEIEGIIKKINSRPEEI